jgi:protein-S-isoprenylcysteine O-methyltransferase Ste14
MTTILLPGLAILWLSSEITLNQVTRTRRGSAVVRDRYSGVILWGTIFAAFAAAALLERVQIARIRLPREWLDIAGILLLMSGMAIRALAIVTLGRFFDATVTIRADHRVVRAGIYRRVRHPSYSGLLLAFLGLSLMFVNWLSTGIMFVLVCAALLYRIRVEEAALVAALGRDYIEYQHSTKRLIPGLF